MDPIQLEELDHIDRLLKSFGKGKIKVEPFFTFQNDPNHEAELEILGRLSDCINLKNLPRLYDVLEASSVKDKFPDLTVEKMVHHFVWRLRNCSAARRKNDLGHKFLELLKTPGVLAVMVAFVDKEGDGEELLPLEVIEPRPEPEENVVDGRRPVKADEEGQVVEKRLVSRVRDMLRSRLSRNVRNSGRGNRT